MSLQWIKAFGVNNGYWAQVCLARVVRDRRIAINFIQSGPLIDLADAQETRVAACRYHVLHLALIAIPGIRGLVRYLLDELPSANSLNILRDVGHVLRSQALAHFFHHEPVGSIIGILETHQLFEDIRGVLRSQAGGDSRSLTQVAVTGRAGFEIL